MPRPRLSIPHLAGHWWAKQLLTRSPFNRFSIWDKHSLQRWRTEKNGRRGGWTQNICVFFISQSGVIKDTSDDMITLLYRAVLDQEFLGRNGLNGLICMNTCPTVPRPTCSSFRVWCFLWRFCLRFYKASPTHSNTCFLIFFIVL